MCSFELRMYIQWTWVGILFISYGLPVSGFGKQTPSIDAEELCKPQGILRLDVPSQRPRNPDIALPFCSEYQSCTCCNASHAVAIRRTLVSVLKDKGMSSSCKQLSKQFACRVCDPWVGVGLKQGVCMAMCDRWFQACRTNFFEFDLLSGLLVPSAEESQRSLLSGQLHVLVNNGTDMCRKAGIQVIDSSSSQKECWDGAFVPHGNLCDNKYMTPSHKQARQFSWFPGGISTFFVVCFTFLIIIGFRLYYCVVSGKLADIVGYTGKKYL